MSQGFNPYTPPSQYGFSPETPPHSKRQLASLGKRFLGAVLDSLVGILIVPGVVMVVMGFAADEKGDDDTAMLLFIAGGVWCLVTFLALFVMQLYLLYTRSQSIGKYLVKTQIVDFSTGRRADFVHCFLLRGLVNGIIGSLPYIGSLYSLIDILCIFGNERRCLHDQLASTAVVDISLEGTPYIR